jgi:hypothetical protein
MINNIINFFNNLKCDLSIWYENYQTLEKEKFYKGRKIILLVKKLKNTWEGKILVITYRKGIDIIEDTINWKNEPYKLYGTDILMSKDINLSKEAIQKTMEDLFIYYFLEKKEKLKFKK